MRIYQSIYSNRLNSVLPEATQDAVHQIGKGSFFGRTANEKLIARYRCSLKALPAEGVPQGAAEIRGIAGLHRHSVYRNQIGEFFRLTDDPVRQLRGYRALLEAHPDIGWLMMFHENGYVRHLAMEVMEAMKSLPNCPFEVAAVIYRMNDWVENVRAASRTYVVRNFSLADPTVLAESAFFLLPQIRKFSRWEKESQGIVEQCFYRPEVLAALQEKLMQPRGGKIGSFLRTLLQRPDFDGYLEGLALNAVMPIVRAVATETLLLERARWFVAYRYDYDDKFFGISSRVAESATRKIEVEYSMDNVLEGAASDRSVLVRKLAAGYLIANRENMTPKMRGILGKLRSDQSSAVAERIEFLDKKLLEANRGPYQQTKTAGAMLRLFLVYPALFIPANYALPSLRFHDPSSPLQRRGWQWRS